jgi:hypothetical protein
VSRSFRASFEGKSYYLKFDLVKTSLAAIPELARLAKETGAIRSCAVVRTHGAWEPLSELPGTCVDDPNWKVIKIPSLDGNELWLVPESKQSEMELKMGFDRPSEALQSIPAKTILASSFRDPVFRAETKFKLKPDVICTSVTGLTLLSPTDRWSLEQLENLKDLGNFAFED